MNDRNKKDTIAEIKELLSRHSRASKITLGVLFAIAMLIVLWGIVSLVLVFFSVEEIELRGDTCYSQEEIIAVSEIEKGSRLYYIGAEEKEKKLLSEFPYIEDVQIRAYFPNKAVIEIKEYENVFICNTKYGYVSFNESFDVLEIRNDEDFQREKTIALSLPGENAEGNSILSAEDENIFNNMLESFKSFEYADLITRIDISDKYSLSFELGGVCRVVIGNIQSIDKKLSLAKKIYDSEKFDKEEFSIIDVSNEKKISFRYVTEKDFEK